MLRRLELVGFKSFADKTLFEFSPGVTAIVGPNGSGKSNVVDAIRWILGEQSAKSLRGQEMADVIFNGSASRRSVGMAEVTMTFDNARRAVTVDADEVRITRRVYRDGEGEYLINQQPARLKDIKEIFLGSGAGADAYCIIEQGRVDVLLQASTQDRRVIFEEAAGISRFRARKLETLRKLERVGQNLQRLRDIFDEVEKQLRSVKLQAAKAQRYQEYNERLKQLRVGQALREFHELAGQQRSETAVLDQLRSELQQNSAQAEAWEEELHRLEQALAQLEETLHAEEYARTEARQQIAAEEATLAHERELSADLETDLDRTRVQAAEQAGHVAALALSAAQAGEELRAVEARCEDQRAAVNALVQQQAELTAGLAALDDQIRADKSEHFEQMRQTARLRNDVVSFKAQMDNLDRERQRLLQRSAQAAGHLASLDIELGDLTAAEEAVQGKLSLARHALTDQRAAGDCLRQARDDKAAQLADGRARRSGLASRIEVLEDLERSHEGLGAGVREVFELLAAETTDVPLPDCSTLARNILGLVADLITVPREHAALIDVALGETAQRFVVRDAALLDEALRSRASAFLSRVGFLRLRSATVNDRPASLMNMLCIPWSVEALRADPRVLAGADHLVSATKPELADLPRQLLGQTFLVTDLAAGRSLAAHTSGCRFLTVQGELLEADGTLTVGTYHAEAGLLSRKSELRELRAQSVELDGSLAGSEKELAEVREQINQSDARVDSLQQERAVLVEQEADLRSRIGQHRERRDGLRQEVTLSRTEMSSLESDLRALTLSWTDARTQADAAEQRVHQLETRLQEADQEIRRGEGKRQQVQQNATSASVALAQAEERLTAVRAKHRQIQADWQQRAQEKAQTEARLHDLQVRLQESERTMLRASAALAQWYLDKETAERHLAECGQVRDQRRTERQQLAEQTQAGRTAWREQQEQAHLRELAVNDLNHKRDQLESRLREDYQLELADLYRDAAASGELHAADENRQVNPAPSATTEDEEIEELRRKLTRLGSVNLEALKELAELEERANVLQTQVDDLTSAQRALEEIINKINSDSRKLFAESFEAIRGHFQELFRKLFGGGMADIVLEDENDMLESGIDIIARPPGKELRNLSLMSGGEKTMTAVALLLAIFRSKPSPFCILDEVDAALDESNIGRFTAVLREFLDLSQFILITHSKRTMSAADVLYGVTMQESGVSKRMTVRFEDWPEEEASIEMRKAA